VSRRVVLINVVPQPGAWDARDCSNVAVLIHARRCLPPPFALHERAKLRAANSIEDRAAALGGAHVWNFGDEICPDDRCAPVRDGALVWLDPEHISVATSNRLAPVARRYL